MHVHREPDLSSLCPYVRVFSSVYPFREVLAARLPMMPNKAHQTVVFFIFWWILLVRKWLLPALMMGGVLEQTLTNPLSPAQQLLNSIAICFIMDFDNLIWVYLRPHCQEKITHIMAHVEEQMIEMEVRLCAVLLSVYLLCVTLSCGTLLCVTLLCVTLLCVALLCRQSCAILCP